MRPAPSGAPALVEFSPSILAGIAGVDQEIHLSCTGGGLDAIGAVDQIAGTRLHPETIESSLAKRLRRAIGKVSGNCELRRLERALERSFQLPIGNRPIQPFTADRNPSAAPRSACTNVGCDSSIRAERQPDQLIARALSARQDAGALWDVRV